MRTLGSTEFQGLLLEAHLHLAQVLNKEGVIWPLGDNLPGVPLPAGREISGPLLTFSLRQSTCLAWTKPWVPSLAVHKPGLVAHICKLNTREDGEFEASLDYMRPCLKKTRNQNQNKAKKEPESGKEPRA